MFLSQKSCQRSPLLNRHLHPLGGGGALQRPLDLLAELGSLGVCGTRETLIILLQTCKGDRKVRSIYISSTVGHCPLVGTSRPAMKRFLHFQLPSEKIGTYHLVVTAMPLLDVDAAMVCPLPPCEISACVVFNRRIGCFPRRHES